MEEGGGVATTLAGGGLGGRGVGEDGAGDSVGGGVPGFFSGWIWACWKDLSLFLKRDGRTKSHPRAKKASSPRKSGSSLNEASLIIIFAMSKDSKSEK